MNTIQIDTMQTKAVGAGALFLLIFLTGLWLNRAGAPYGVIGLTIHKMIALAALALLGQTVYQIHQAAPLNVIQMTAVAVTGVIFIATIVGGGLLSTDKPMPAILSTIHLVTPFLTVLATAVALYLLFRKM